MDTPPATHHQTAKRGRPRKQPMEEIKPWKQKLVTFIKRRAGLFNKAAELCMLCDAQVALLVSCPRPQKKDPSSPVKSMVYSFGNTSVDAILDAFLAGVVPCRMDADTTRFALSLSSEIKKMESESSHILRHKKTEVVIGDQMCPWFSLEEFEKSGKTIAELQALVDSLDNLRAKALSKLNNSSCTDVKAASTSDISLLRSYDHESALQSHAVGKNSPCYGRGYTLNSFSTRIGVNDAPTKCIEYNDKSHLPTGDRGVH